MIENSAKKIKVLYLDELIFPIGGGQRSLAVILDNIDSNVYESVVLKVGEDVENSYFDIIKKLKQLFKEEKIDIIHCNAGASRVSFIAALYAKKNKIPFIWHTRVIDASVIRDIIMGILATKIIVISEAVRNRFKKILLTKKTKKIYNAVDIDIFKPDLDTAYLYDEFNLNRNSRCIGIFSRIDRWKGHRLFLQIIKELEGTFKDGTYLIVGDGEEEYKNELIDYQKELGIKSRLIYTGFREDIPKLINLCDVVVHTSIEPEPFGRTIIEAMACGKPVVATNLGGPLEIIKNNINGVLVDPKPEAMAQELIKLLKEEELRNQISQESIKSVKEIFSVEAHLKAISLVYNDVRKN